VPIVVTLGYVFGRQLEIIVKYLGGFERLIVFVLILSALLYGTRIFAVRKTPPDAEPNP
jgi:membrane protein DedA with SNARE-associated domain